MCTAKPSGAAPQTSCKHRNLACLGSLHKHRMKRQCDLQIHACPMTLSEAQALRDFA